MPTRLRPGCSLFTLGDLLYAVRLSLCRAAHRGDQLLVRAKDLLRLHCDLLLALYNLDLNLFLPDLLLLPGALQLIGQLGLGRLRREDGLSEAGCQVLSPPPGMPDGTSP